MKQLNRIPVLPKGHTVCWYACRTALFIWGAWGLLHGYASEFTQACFAIAFTHLWDLFQLLGGRSFITRYPYQLQTMLNCFICFSCVVGTTVNTRTDFKYIDIPEHLFAGYMACYGAFFLAEIMQGKKRPLKVSVQGLFAFNFAVAILVGWEFYEFTMDRLYGFTMQHGELGDLALTDTMTDLILGTAGALIGMLVEWFRRVGLIGKHRAAVRAAYKQQREAFKKEKARLYAEGKDVLENL
ncbi:MAG: hypothetical protein IKN72_00260 [Clostridia bacterium]|nr:hypothetical protein [Clostridia bacterium]